MHKIFIFLLILQVQLFADENKWIAIGDLHNWYSSSGAEREVGRRGIISDQQDGLRFPALYKFQDMQVAKALWIGTVDYNDPLLEGKLFSHKVVHNGPRVLNEESEFMPVEFRLVGKYHHPVVKVDGTPATNNLYADLVDEIDKNLVSDRMLYNVVNTGIGITMTRKIYAFSQQNHDNYHIYEYVFKNTGIFDKDGSTVNQTLKDVVFFFQYRYAPTREIGPYGYNFAPQSTSWGKSTMLDVRGEDPGSEDPFRALYSWLGRHSQESANLIGGPNTGGDGHLGAAQFVGSVVLHADKSAEDNSNDPNQPSTTHYLGSDESITANNSHFDSTKMVAEYAAMAKGHAIVRHADAVGNGYTDLFGGTPGGYSHTQGFGPYNLAPEDSIRIIIAEGVAGLSRELCYSVGDEWLNGDAPFSLPDGTTTSNRDEFKNAWVFTGRDSLFNTFTNAVLNYEGGYNIPDAPVPPDTFKVDSFDDYIQLTWSSNAEEDENFAGYSIFRALNRPDTTFEQIYSCGLNTDNPQVVNHYEDKDVSPGNDYYYYIQSFDNGATNNGTPLYSSLFWTKTNEPGFVKIDPNNIDDTEVKTIPQKFTLYQNYPNPFNPATKIRFYLDKPSETSIKIYDISGRVVTTIKKGFLNTGFHIVEFNASNFASGIYIYEVSSDQQRLRKKMTLLK
ncbi:MAG: T9SS C-terminal target domain-containing protein [Calditrichaeota bacterium]|nr:MAG: T9SS C-terminal target domain-containing protein [Calditrichota bacterium]MBL1205406.1 T9SS C-terminal target domain-containing protein [Calditrichota bacterium]NOG45235.1 T9SS type A sorting domain-containing protein [Calditrichota bacterium]